MCCVVEDGPATVPLSPLKRLSKTGVSYPRVQIPRGDMTARTAADTVTFIRCADTECCLGEGQGKGGGGVTGIPKSPVLIGCWCCALNLYLGMLILKRLWNI